MRDRPRNRRRQSRTGSAPAGGRGSGRLRRSVRRHARESLGDILAGELRHPAVLVGEQADRHEVRRFAHVEPVAGAVRHADQVALFAQDVVDLVTQVQGELAGAEL